MKIALFSAFIILICSGCTKTYNYPTVNQVFSAVYTVQPNQWVQATDQGVVYYYTSLSVPELTQAIDLNGGVITYLSFDPSTATDPTYEAMPEVFSGIAYGSLHTTGSVTIDLRAADGSNLTSAISAPTLIKVVLMDASPLGN
jgi:hypothetical protein